MKRMIDDKIINKLSVKNDVLEIKGTINADKITGDEIVENMEGYSFTPSESTGSWTITHIYEGVVKNGNKITFVVAFKMKATEANPSTEFGLGRFNIPKSIWDKLYPVTIEGYEFLSIDNSVAVNVASYGTKKDTGFYTQKVSVGGIYGVSVAMKFSTTGISANDEFYQRLEITFLTSENLA